MYRIFLSNPDFKFILETISTNEDAQTMLSDIFISFEDDKIGSDAWILANFNSVSKIDFTNLLSKEKSDFGLDWNDYGARIFENYTEPENRG